MKISAIFNQAFKGYGAGRIKALYMTNPGNQRQLNIYNELRNIGQNEGFDVFMHNGKELKNEPLTEIEQEFNFWGVWSQDNKMIIKDEGKSAIVACALQPKDEFLEAQLFCQNANMQGYSTDLIFDGGDVFLGKKDDGKNYLMTSQKTLNMNAIFQYLKQKSPQNATRKMFLNLVNNGFCVNEKGENIATLDECSLQTQRWEDFAKTMFCEVFDVEPQNLVILPEAEFHLDLTIRPLDYPYVLVNDDNEVDELMDRLYDKFENNFLARFKLDEIDEKIFQQRKIYSSSDVVCKELEKAGFIPIKIAGMLGRGYFNFMNAIVHKNGDELVYITNAVKNDSEFYNFIQDEFEAQLLTKCPQIKKVYFVSGEKVGKDLNDIMIYLKDFKGGIHCLCAEEME